MTQSIPPPDTVQDEGGICVTFFDPKTMSGEEIDKFIGDIFGHNTPPAQPTNLPEVWINLSVKSQPPIRSGAFSFGKST